MKRIVITTLILSLAGLYPLLSQETTSKKPEDPLRVCVNVDAQRSKAVGSGELILPEISWGNNPQERQYRQEIERLLKIEINNVKGAVEDVVRKHKDLVKLYPDLANYQEIILEDVPGAWRDNEYVNSKKVLSMHYDAQHQLTCLVLDSMTRNVYYPSLWTRKLMRLYYPNIQTMELETRKQNFKLNETIENTSPEIQLKALRLVFLNLRTALYSMDMMIAAYYDMRNKKNEWQINM